MHRIGISIFILDPHRLMQARLKGAKCPDKIIPQLGNQEARRKTISPKCTTALSWVHGFLHRKPMKVYEFNLVHLLTLPTALIQEGEAEG